jgi:hypothetical protein
VRQWRCNPADSVREFAKISRRKGSILQQIEEKGVCVASHGFHRIERERIPIALVRVEHAQ